MDSKQDDGKYGIGIENSVPIEKEQVIILLIDTLLLLFIANI